MLSPSRMLLFAAVVSLAGAVAAQDAADDLEPTHDPTLVPPTEEQVIDIHVLTFGEHPANQGCLEGIRAGLQQYGYAEGDTLNLHHHAAEGDADRLEALVGEMTGAEATLIAPVGAEAARAVAGIADVPVVFCAVQDPIAAGLVDSMMHPGGNATGVSDAVPLSQQLALIRELLPAVMMLGVIHDADDESSVRLVERLTTFLPGAGFQLAEATVASAEEMGDAVRDLAGEADVVYILPGAVTLEGLEGAIQAAEESQMPLFVADAQLVTRGAIGSRAFDYVTIGRQTADLMARVLDGENPADIPVGQAEETYLVVNVTAAERMGLQLAPGFVARADEVIE